MTYKIILSKTVSKFLKNCDKYIAKSFHEKVLIIAKAPYTAYENVDVTAIV